MRNWAVFSCILLATVDIGSANAARNCSAVMLDTTHLSAALEQSNKTIRVKEVELDAEKRRTANLMIQIDRYMKRGDILHGKLNKCIQQGMRAENVKITLTADLSASKQRCKHLEQLCKTENVSNTDVWEQVNVRSNLSLCKQRETHLQARLSRSQQENSDLTKHLNESRGLIPILNTEMEKARQERLKAENVSHALRREVLELKSELAEFNQSSGDLQDEIVTIKQRSDTLAKQLETCRKKQNLALSTQEEVECDDSGANLEEARVRLDKEKKRRSKAERDLKVSKQEMGRLKVDVENFEEQLTGCKMQQGNDKKQLLKAEKEIKSLKQQVSQIKSDYESAKQDSEKLEEQALETKLHYKKEVEQEKKLRITSKTELIIVKQEFTQTRSDLSEANRLSENLSKQLENVTGLHKLELEKLKLLCLKSANDTCQKELMQLRSALYEANMPSGNVSKQFENAKIQHKTNLKDIICRSEKENALKSEYRSQSSLHMQEINKLTTQLNETRKISEELSEQVKKATDIIQCLRAEVEYDDCDTNIEEARSQVEDEQIRRSKAERDLKASKQALSQLKVDFEELEGQLTGCKANLENEKKLRLILRKDLKSMKQQFSQQKSACEAAMRMSKMLDEQVQKSKIKDKNDGEQEKRLRIELEKELKDVRQELMQTRSDLNKANMRSENISKQLENVTYFYTEELENVKGNCLNESFQQELVQLRSDLYAANLRSENLSKQLENATDLYTEELENGKSFQQELVQLKSDLYAANQRSENLSKQFDDTKVEHKMKLKEISSRLENESTLQSEQNRKLTNQLDAAQRRSEELAEQLKQANQSLERMKDQRKGGPPTSLFPEPTEAMLKEAVKKSADVPPTELCDPSGSWWWVLEKGRVADVDTGRLIPGFSVLEMFKKLKRDEYGWIGGPFVILPVGLGGVKMSTHFSKHRHMTAVTVWFSVRNDDYNMKTAQVRFPFKLRVKLRFYSPSTRKPIWNMLTKVITLTKVSYASDDSLIQVPSVVLSRLSQLPVIHVTFSSP